MATVADLCVVGAGPAGLSAAAVAARRGLDVIVLDESPEAGGRVRGQLHHGTSGRSDDWWRGAQVAHELTAVAVDAGVKIFTRTSVCGIWRGFRVTSDGDGPVEITAARLLLAAGAGEQPLPMPGWTLPGVVSIGAAQVLVNVHRVMPGKRVLVVGIDPLSIAISHSLMLAGVNLLGVANAPPGALTAARSIPADNLVMVSGAARAAGPSMALRLAGGLVQSRQAAALALRLLPRGTIEVWDVPVQFGTAVLVLEGDDRVREAVVAPVSPEGHVTASKAQRVAVDAVCLSGGLTPLVELAAVVGCALAVVPALGGQIPLHGPEQETTVPGLYVAGSMAGVESAEAAMEQGRIAGLAVARDAGALDRSTAERDLAATRQRLDAVRASSGTRINPNLLAGRAEVSRRWRELSAGMPAAAR